MRKFEYKQEKVEPDSLAQLNREGQDGWELTIYAMDAQPNRLAINGQPVVVPVFVFKREITNDEQK